MNDGVKIPSGSILEKEGIPVGKHMIYDLQHGDVIKQKYKDNLNEDVNKSYVPVGAEVFIDRNKEEIDGAFELLKGEEYK